MVLVLDAVKKILSGQGYTDLTVNLFGKVLNCDIILSNLHFSTFFPGTMAENGRMNKAGDVLQAFSTIMQAHKGIVSCAVTSAKVSQFVAEAIIMYVHVHVSHSFVGSASNLYIAVRAFTRYLVHARRI